MLKHAIHNVKFSGFYQSTKNPNKDYIDKQGPRNSEVRLDENAKKYIELVSSFKKEKLKIVDFGGGLGGHYNTLKKYTNKKFFYDIVERENAHCDISSDVKYHKSIDSVDKNEGVDILYSNAVIFLTPNITAVENIKNFCKLNSKYILLQRTICVESKKYKHFYTKSGYYWSIISDSFLVDICKEHDYILQYEEYGEDITEFIVRDSPNDLGMVCYKNFLFKKTK